jgi:hypothetical protein
VQLRHFGIAISIAALPFPRDITSIAWAPFNFVLGFGAAVAASEGANVDLIGSELAPPIMADLPFVRWLDNFPA